LNATLLTASRAACSLAFLFKATSNPGFAAGLTIGLVLLCCLIIAAAVALAAVIVIQRRRLGHLEQFTPSADEMREVQALLARAKAAGVDRVAAKVRTVTPCWFQRKRKPSP
jgi:hypothetical protein